MTNTTFWAAVLLLGGMQILAWGSTYYTPTVILPHLVRETGWSVPFILGGVSLALAIGGLSTSLAARGIASGRGAWCLGGSSLFFAAGLACLGLSTNHVLYALSWAILGVGMGFGLYDAAFSIINVACGADCKRARRAITLVTLVAGFASTLAWPALAFMIEQRGWRNTCFLLATVHATLGVAVNTWLAGRCFAPQGTSRKYFSGTGSPASQEPPVSVYSFVPLVAAFSLLAFINVAFSSNILALLQGLGAQPAMAVAAALWFGPAQVGARLIETFAGWRWHPRWTVVTGGMLLSGGLAALYHSNGEAVALNCAMVAYGAGNGLLTIARGTLPLVLYPDQYIQRLSLQARYVLCSQAVAPLVVGLLWEYTLPRTLLAFMGLLSLVALAFIATCVISQQRRKPA